MLLTLLFATDDVLGYHYLPDWQISTTVGMPPVSNFYFFWTNFFYLPFFFFLLSLLTLLTLFQNIPSYFYFTVLVVFTFYLAELNDLITINAFGVVSDLLSTQINTLLINNLNSYHPFFFYLGVLLFFNLSFEFLLTSLATQSLYPLTLLLQANTQYPIRWTTLLGALFLGSWWALQEGTWGGWWNWDSSEVFGLAFMFAYLPIFHPVLTFALLFNLTTYLLGATTFLIVYYVLLQLGFEIVSHNFGVKNFFFFNNNTSLISVLLLLPFSLNLRFNNILLTPLYPLARLHQTKYHSLSLNLNPFLNPLPWALTVVILLISLFPLLHHLLISFFGINFCNSEPTFWVFRYFSPFLLLYLLTILFSIPLDQTPLAIPLFRSLTPTTLNVSNLHNLTLLFFLIVPLSSSFFNSSPLFAFYLADNLDANSPSLGPFSLLIDESNLFLTQSFEVGLGGSHFSFINFWINSNAGMGNVFIFSFSNNNFESYYDPTTAFNRYCIRNNSNFLTQLPLLLTLIYTSLLNAFSRNPQCL